MVSSGIGILFALLALVFWGIGDFLIQKSVRKIGDWESLFIISLFGLIVIFPFVYQDIPLILDRGNLALFCILSITFLIASLFQFESYKIGKISVVEPIQVVEIPISALLAYIFLKEGLACIIYSRRDRIETKTILLDLAFSYRRGISLRFYSIRP